MTPGPGADDADDDPMRRPGDLPRRKDPARPHDPRRMPQRDDVERGPRGGETPRDGADGEGRRDGPPKPRSKGRAPLPDLPHPGRDEPAD